MKLFFCSVLYLILIFTFTVQAGGLIRKNADSKASYILTTDRSVEKKDLNFLPEATIKNLGNNFYLLEFKKDPGLILLEKKLEHTGWKIQSNYQYKVRPETRRSLRPEKYLK